MMIEQGKAKESIQRSWRDQPGTRRCLSRTACESGETANKSSGVIQRGQVSAARQVGSEKQSKQVSEAAK